VALAEPISDADLRAHRCLKSVDRVPDDPETTAFKRRARLHQALWREARRLKIGSQPMRPKPGVRPEPLGSRIDLDVARETGANFLSETVRKAIRHRLENPEPYQMLDEDRLYCDLLSSMPMCFNLFGALQADVKLADRAVHSWWPNVPGRVRGVLFEWSPGRRLPGRYLENRSAFDVAFELELQGGKRGLLGVETKYHEHCKREKVPSARRRRRYAEVSAKSGLFSLESIEAIIGTDLQQIWLDHLLALSMTQEQSQKWAWTGFVLIHPRRNPSYAHAIERYRSLLSNPTSVRVCTIESLLEGDVLPEMASRVFAERYLW